MFAVFTRWAAGDNEHNANEKCVNTRRISRKVGTLSKNPLKTKTRN